MITLGNVRNDPYIIELLMASDRQIAALGYTEHGIRHAEETTSVAGQICKGLGLSEWETNVAMIGSFLHDIGNLTGRDIHGQVGAAMITPILLKLDASPEELSRIITAISCHDDEDPVISNATTAVVIMADKTDVSRSRVRPTANIQTDIHDRVNYAVLDRQIEVSRQNIALRLNLDETIANSADYLDIFAKRMQAMRKSAQFLGCQFDLSINGNKIF